MPFSAASFEVPYVAQASHARTAQMKRRSPSGGLRTMTIVSSEGTNELLWREPEQLGLRFATSPIPVRFQQLTLEVQCKLLANGRS